MTKEIIKEKTIKKHQNQTNKERELILINDEVHDFDYVISALIDVCEHTYEQASQCTLITHYKGQCDVKKGSIKQLRPLRRALVSKELKAIIN